MTGATDSGRFGAADRRRPSVAGNRRHGMVGRRRFGEVALAAALAALLACLSPGAPAQAAETARPFSHKVAEWDRIFEEVERYMALPGATHVRTATLRGRLENIRISAAAAQREATDELTRVRELLEALGEPEEGLPESPDIAERRKRYREEAGFFRDRIQHASLAIVRVEHLDSGLSHSARSRLATRILVGGPLPFMPGSFASAWAETGRIAERVAAAWADWRQSLAKAEGAFLKAVLLWVVAGALGFAVRRFLPPAETVASAAYHRRLLAILVAVTRRGAVPILLLLATAFAVRHEGGLSTAAFSGLVGSLALCLAVAVALALLGREATARPGASVLPEIPEGRAPRVARLTGWFGILVGLDIFIGGQFDVLDAGPSFRALVGGAVHFLEAVVIAAMARAVFWPVQDSDGAFRRIARWALIGVPAAVVLAVLAGYARLGEYLAHLLLFGGGTALALLVLCRVVHATVLSSSSPAAEGGASGESAPGDGTLGDARDGQPPGIDAIRFWLSAAVDVAAVLLWILVMAPFVGVAGIDLRHWAEILLTDLNLGNISISILDIVVAGAVFMASMTVTRMLQRSLSERILPKTRIDASIQHSLATTFGYFGIVVSGILAVTALGVDLTSLAVIAGAFSVGIGFGLQNIVNNFVSGLILLVQRPIKVGDWVMAGEHQGIIKRVGVRATELETFQRASVIIPNSELVSGRVTNWTHDNRYGRVEIAVGVGYDSDTGQVRDILLACAREHPEISRSDPEPYVMFRDFADSCLMFELRCVTPNVMRRAGISSEIRYEIIRRFREEGIEIPFPQRVVHLQDETVPS